MSILFKAISASVLAASATLGLLASQPAWSQAEPFRVGIIASETGAVSFLGDPFIKSVRMRVDAVNAAGGINGRKVQLFAYDDESSPDKALAFAKRLVAEDKVSVILGPSLSSTTRAILPTTEAAKVPVLYNTPINEPPPGSFQFSVWPSEETSYRVALQELQKRGVKRLGVLATTDTTGESGFSWLNKLAPTYGMAVVGAERLNINDKDVTPQMTVLRGKNPDAVFTALSGAAVAAVCRSYVRLGMKQPLVFSTGAVTSNFPELLKGITPDTLIFPTYKVLLGPDALLSSDPSRKPLVEYFKDYQAKYGKVPDSTGGSGFDAAGLAFLALGKVNVNDPLKVREALQQVKNYAGVNAVYTFTPEQQRGAGPSEQRMGQFKDGKFMMIKN
jgi:branched-chain amino acid transport system substrate-binding protein